MPKHTSRSGLSIEFHREAIRVDTVVGERVADPRWKHTDTNGHVHAFAGEELPSLEWVVTGTEWVGDEFDSSEIEVGEYRCRVCGEMVKPRWNRDYSPRFIPGLLDAKVSTDDGRVYLLRSDEIETLSAAADKEAAAWAIVDSREPDAREWRGFA